jgi:hypothetical protein
LEELVASIFRVEVILDGDVSYLYNTKTVNGLWGEGRKGRR